LVAIFARIFRDFAPIVKDIVRIFEKSKLLVVRLHPCTPPLTPLLLILVKSAKFSLADSVAPSQIFAD